MYRLPPDRFETWFRALNGCAPFPWQTRLFSTMLCPADSNQARWPQSISLPTASGKTALIDLAVLALACGSPCSRRRIVFVVDRRLVVDEAARRAERLARRLREASVDERHPLHEVSRSLIELGGDPEEPLLVARLRGGMQFDESWARDPVQPAVILSTVDQAGSRLLFRAYGPTGPRSWSIAAGLLGIDTLFLVDEAHCARPFCETITAIQSRWQQWAKDPIQPGIVSVQISATLTAPADFTLDEQDIECPPLRRRLNTRKLVSLTSIPTKEPAKREPLEKEFVEKAKEWLGRTQAGVLAIVVNRVASARRIHHALPLPEENKLLLTGRARPRDRDRLLEFWMERLHSGRAAAERQYAVVATQCVEVGADFDFDYLISEAASLDALRQRFGRLDRLGERNARLGVDPATEPAGCILALGAQVALDENGKPPKPDAVYGTALAATWHFLEQAKNGAGQVDFCHLGLTPLLSQCENPEALVMPAPRAFPLLPAYLDLLAQTSPTPEPDVEISAFLHGTTSPSADVLIVWRADLEPDDPEAWLERVAVQPPLPGEACPVPVWEARSWLAGKMPELDNAHDLEEQTGAETQNGGGAGRKALAWRGPEDSVIRNPGEVRPGDLLVVPSRYGGCTRFGWAPESTAEVEDIGDAVTADLGRRAVLRIGLLRQLDSRVTDAVEAEVVSESSLPAGQREGKDQAESGISFSAIAERIEEAASAPDLEPFERRQSVDAALELLCNRARAAGVDWLASVSERLLGDQRREPEFDEKERLIALVGSKAARGEAHTATETAQFRRGRPVTLQEHSEGVKEVAERFVRTLRLPDRLSKSIQAAAQYHDLGKADPRFQAWLRGIALFIPTCGSDILAKSDAITPRNLSAIRQARSLAGYPEDARHEALSAALAMEIVREAGESCDTELTLHLIASHHGHARPFFPVVASGERILVELEFNGGRLSKPIDYQEVQTDPAVADRFWHLVRRYGWWGLAFLEAVFRLADHRRSEQEEING